MKKQLYRAFVELTGNRFNSHLLRTFTTSRLSKGVNRSFTKVYNLKTEEMEKPLHEYKSLHELFTRRLKEGTRPIDLNQHALVSPVDGVLAHVGSLNEQSAFRVKGQDYTLQEMLGSTEKSQVYCGGTFVILYLSPSHYHRIHSPISGRVLERWQLGNKSYPVNRQGLQYGKRPLSKNYRLITEVEVHHKRAAIVKVGALNVNSIHLTHDGKNVEKGKEIGYFSFGSTVILLFEHGLVELDPQLQCPTEVKVGMRIGTIFSKKDEA
ncbi:phosphatidylserine decarboxylase [Alkalihalobacterium alkalinitrilicum]|uniref:phosphatidylserine decarboxylase n=1 Tax=Alkalihalobacterium alkalinitrilicum TaxID=427920 RepID=UPI000994E90C|nr:phosphatidylserine decarboxylase [Alkalihalobacterium alkalinitrilicum]